jgi:integrase
VKWARDIENKIDKGIFVSMAEAESTTLHEALERYENEISKEKKGYESEKYRIKSWKAHKLACRSLASLRGTDFAKYRDERLAAGLAPATVRLDLALISHLFTIAVKEWDIPLVNPVKNIRLPKVDNARERRLEDGEEAALMSAIDNPGPGTRTKEIDRRNIYIKPMVIFAIETALRQSEMFSTFNKKRQKVGLWWENIDLKKRVARVIDTKNGDSYRDIPLSLTSVKVLEALPHSIDGRVFPTTASALKQSWNRAVKRARLEYEKKCKAERSKPSANFMHDLHFHDLRHEATTRLAEIFPMQRLMKITGHKDTRMLARYYHPRAEDMAKEMDSYLANLESRTHSG